MQLPVLYLISKSADKNTVLEYLELTPPAAVIATSLEAGELAKAISSRVLLDTDLNGLVARYLKLAQETVDCPIAIVGDFIEPIFAVEPNEN